MCPYCGSNTTKNLLAQSNSTVHTRLCLNCKQKFHTEEYTTKRISELYREAQGKKLSGLIESICDKILEVLLSRLKDNIKIDIVYEAKSPQVKVSSKKESRRKPVQL